MSIVSPTTTKKNGPVAVVTQGSYTATPIDMDSRYFQDLKAWVTAIMAGQI